MHMNTRRRRRDRDHREHVFPRISPLPPPPPPPLLVVLVLVIIPLAVLLTTTTTTTSNTIHHPINSAIARGLDHGEQLDRLAQATPPLGDLDGVRGLEAAHDARQQGRAAEELGLQEGQGARRPDVGVPADVAAAARHDGRPRQHDLGDRARLAPVRGPEDPVHLAPVREVEGPQVVEGAVAQVRAQAAHLLRRHLRERRVWLDAGRRALQTKESGVSKFSVFFYLFLPISYKRDRSGSCSGRKNPFERVLPEHACPLQYLIFQIPMLTSQPPREASKKEREKERKKGKM